MKLVLEPSQPFNLELTLCCGQVFRWEKIGEWWFGVADDKAFKVRQTGRTLEFENVSQDFVEKYFGLDNDLPAILKQITRDAHVTHAVKALEGLRIIRQDLWECLISYICATYKNIPSIKQMLFNLSRKFGCETVLDGRLLYTFPTAERLAHTSLKELAECGLGYRARYVLETAQKVASGEFNIEKLKTQNYGEARNALLCLKGVGLKVADCVSLFALEKFEAFPVDVWMKRVIIRHYANHFEEDFVKKISLKKSLTKADYEKLNSFGRKYFGEYAGYAQEYLYHFERISSKGEKSSY
ncbi:8-oxoguanine DNA glycosylase [Candidatus Bathyarchaeota archaeon]|nr:8-oxoguanine DNA glycosylase [Candidatus Bathyarchaeota archaeon]